MPRSTDSKLQFNWPLIRRLYAAKGWTLTDLADRSGVDERTLSQPESHFHLPRTGLAIAGALEVELSEIILSRPHHQSHDSLARYNITQNAQDQATNIAHAEVVHIGPQQQVKSKLK